MSDTDMTREQVIEQGLARGMCHEEANRYADAYEAGRAARTADLTVTVRGTRYMINGSTLDAIRLLRNQAGLHKAARNARDEVFTRQEITEMIENLFAVPPETADKILAAVKLAPVKGWKPDHLDLAVRWDRGWKVYEVTGTRHAYYLLLKLALRDGFQGARLNTPVARPDGWIVDQVMSLSDDDVTGSDTHGKFRSLLDRNNSHYDLTRDHLAR